jgi:hypothetical protein
MTHRCLPSVSLSPQDNRSCPGQRPPAYWHTRCSGGEGERTAIDCHYEWVDVDVLLPVLQFRVSDAATFAGGIVDTFTFLNVTLGYSAHSSSCVASNSWSGRATNTTFSPCSASFFANDFPMPDQSTNPYQHHSPYEFRPSVGSTPFLVVIPLLSCRLGISTATILLSTCPLQATGINLPLLDPVTRAHFAP